MKKGISEIISIITLIAMIQAVSSGQTGTDHFGKDAAKRFILSDIMKSENASFFPEIEITHQYTNETNGIQYTYFQQKYKGIEVFKAIGNLAKKGPKTFLKKGRIVLDEKLFSSSEPLIDPSVGVRNAANHLGLPFGNAKGHLIRRKDQQYEMNNLPFARGTVGIRQVWANDKVGNYQLSWAIDLPSNVSGDHWEIIVDASNGQVLQELNNTVYCTFHEHAEYSRQSGGESQPLNKKPASPRGEKRNADGSEYRVFAAPLESPAMGDRTLVTNPANPDASPFGWHDIDGVEGPEFNILRGNNVHAYQDTADNNIPGTEETTANSDLSFDFPFDADKSPLENLDADLTNLFYWNNYVHDWTYAFGFNEQAGNFQQNNYLKGGQDGDYVFAETLDGSDVNNANFSAPRDGSNGRMQMYKWVVGNDFEIMAPNGIEGLYNTGNASFGNTLKEAVVAEIVQVDDGIGDRRDACDSIRNGSEFAGKIALIDRGTCDFSFKVHAAQEEGAVACLICNNLDNAALVNMAAGENADQVTIPSLFLSKEDCAIIKSQLLQGPVIGRFNETRELSSSFDNGIVIHEYGHGISMRLSGGPGTSGCLNNDEQMGEGLSDFIGLVLTQLPDDTGELSRGIGTYVIGQTRNSRGIRRYPYSTDVSRNPQVHSHIRASTRPHDVGEIWAGALWDLYWKMIDLDGYDPTWENKASGNFKTMQLVIDGLKLQECDPSLVESRDAIIEADELNFDGIHTCLIWEVFARRGLGVNAEAGDSDDRYDNINGFEIPLSCAGGLRITKDMTPTIKPGDILEVVLTISNFEMDLSDILITDEIPDGTTVIETSSGDNPDVDGPIISFAIGDLAFGEQREIKYTLNTEGLQTADFEVFDEMEGTVNFDRTTNNEDLRGWALTTSQSASGIFALRVASDTLGGQSFAERTGAITVNEKNRLLRFDHQYGTQLGIDGGTLEVSLDQGENWEVIGPEKYLVNPASEQITFDVLYINTIPAFSGERGWHTSIIDLGEYMGQEILVRFRYVSLRFREPVEGIGWFIDNFELYERKELTGQACIASDDVVLACTTDFSLIDSEARRVPVTEIANDAFFFTLQPNPVSDVLQIQINAQQRFNGVLRIVNIEGKRMDQETVTVNAGENYWSRNVANYPPGMYFLELNDQRERFTITFIKQ